MQSTQARLPHRARRCERCSYSGGRRRAVTTRVVVAAAAVVDGAPLALTLRRPGFRGAGAAGPLLDGDGATRSTSAPPRFGNGSRRAAAAAAAAAADAAADAVEATAAAPSASHGDEALRCEAAECSHERRLLLLGRERVVAWRLRRVARPPHAALLVEPPRFQDFLHQTRLELAEVHLQRGNKHG